jgi:DNA helicase HerA-like ATPase
MQHAHKSSKHLICGVSQTGKTTRLIQLIAVHPAPFVFIFDGEGELAERLRITPTPLDAFPNATEMHRVTLVDPAELQRDFAETFRYFCELALWHGEQHQQPSLLVVDEFQRYAGTGSTQLEPEIVDVVERGRRYGVDLLLATQSPNLIHNRIRNQLTEVTSFRLVDARAHAWLEPLGYNGDELRQLQDGRFIWRKVGSDKATVGKI